MKTTVDAFGTEVIVGDTVVFFSPRRTKGAPPRSDKDLRKGEVIKCTPHGATVLFGEQKVSVRSGRIYKVSDGQQRLGLDDKYMMEAYDNGGTISEFYVPEVSQ